MTSSGCGTIRIRNWRKFQHYSNRRPDWIKLHSELLDKIEYRQLPDTSKAQLVSLWLLAARLNDDVESDAEVCADPTYLSNLTGCKFTSQALQVLVSAGFIERASEPLADRLQTACLERDIEREKSREDSPPTPPRGGGVSQFEVSWRIEQVWRAHVEQWREFYRAENGVEPTNPPTLSEEIRAAIKAALLEFDRDLLGSEQRDEWTKRSKARAAGIGIFLDPWCTGNHKDNDVRARGKRYLEPWRPWKHQRGKGSPVDRFAAIYFERKDLHGAA